jgi:Tol biopolymer transport system component/DNA-binding winged helix-turn-helix (wHTH) protein
MKASAAGEMTRKGSDRARFGPFEVDLHTHELWKFGTRLKLVGQPFEILAVLLSKSGELVTREELRTRLWPADTFVDFNHGLNAAVNKLREALSDSADSPRYVETLPRRGYRFIASIEWVQAPVAASAASTVSPALEIREDFPVLTSAMPAGEVESVAGRRWPRFILAAAVLLVLVVAGAVVSKKIHGDGGLLDRMTTSSSPERLLPLNVMGTVEPAFSPDGNSVVFVRESQGAGRSGIFVTAVGSNQPVQITRNDGDCCPVWSPDGRSIAFARSENKEFAIYVISADGGAEEKREAERNPVPTSAAFTTRAGGNERKLNTNGIVPQHGQLDWSPDGKSLVFAGTGGIYLLSLDHAVARRLTESPPLAEDWGPTFSPDGDKLLFVRNHQVGLPDEIWFTAASGGEETRILSEPGKIVSSPQWSYDGRSVIYSSNRSGHPTLWRASLDNPGNPGQIKEAGSPAWDPVVSRRGYRMAYQRLIRSLSIWQLDLSAPNHVHPSLLVPATSDTDQGPAPQFSPDGKKLAYMSDRSGTMEIWVSNRDGSNPFQLTAVGVAGTPDSQSIVFDANSPDGRKVLTINLHGGAPQNLTPDHFESEVPSWSRDGKWIYCASSRGGDLQVWKIPAGGGAPVRVTHQGGHAALESLDGKVLYYSKTPAADPEIWQMPVEGGPETPLPLVRPGSWASWQVVEGGILFVGPSLGHQAVLSFYDFARQRTSTVTILDRVPFWLGATDDGRTVAFDEPGQEQIQTMLVDNFR